MKKVKITADAVLGIVKKIFNDEDINVVIDDQNAPTDWQGKTIQEVLNVEYFTFKHRPVSTDEIIVEKLKEGESGINKLAAIDRSFCVLSLGNVERIYSKDVDMVVVAATMEYWLQTSKVKLLEDLIEECNIALNGLRLSVQFGEGEEAEMRQIVVIFERPSVIDIQTNTPCGEMAVCEVTVNILLYPDVVSYCDYEVKFEFTNDEGETVTSEAIPLSSLSVVNTMTQKAVPYVRQTTKVGNINLSAAKSFVLVFDGYNNEFIDYITSKTLGDDTENNQIYKMTLTRKETEYTHEVVIKDHQITVNADTGNETHTLTLTIEGVSAREQSDEQPSEPEEPEEPQLPEQCAVNFNIAFTGQGNMHGGTIYPSSPLTVDKGTIIQITATPNQYSEFVHFRYVKSGIEYFINENPANILIDQDMTITAVIHCDLFGL